MKKILSVLLAICMIFAVCACGDGAAEVKTADTEKGEGVMTYTEYSAAEIDSDVVIEAYVQAKAYNEAYGNVCLFLQDAEGGYYVYRMEASADDDAALAIGSKVKISGQKAEWAGEVEIANASYELEEGSYVAPATDITSILSDEAALEEKMNMFISVSELTVEALAVDGEESAFWYGWDNTAAAGDNADLYFMASNNDETSFVFCVESDEYPEGSDVYTAVTGLEVGQTIDLEGFLYWYEGMNIHVSAVTVK